MLSHLDMYDGKAFFFTCHCGEKFSFGRGNMYTSPNQFSCRNCKRKLKMIPFVGERYIYRRVKSDARSANREFSLDFDWFVEMIHSPCFYCGRKDINSSTVPSKRANKTLIDHFRYNGLDRINNDIGYQEDNCVPCCIICNRAKNSLPFKDFIEWIETLIQFRDSISV